MGNKKNISSYKRKRLNKMKKGGDCACSKTMFGGDGNGSFQNAYNLTQGTYYDYNKDSGSMNDPLTPSTIVNTRQMGGKSKKRNRKNKKLSKKKRTYKMRKGGGIFGDFLSSFSNPYYSLGTTAGISPSINSLYGTVPGVSASPSSQYINDKFNTYNTPKV